MPFHIVHLGLFFFLHINTIFIYFRSVKPWAHHFPQAAWGVTGKGTYRADTGERIMGGGKSSFILWRIWTRPPSGKRAPWPLRGPSLWCRRATVSEKGSWHKNDEAPEHKPTSSPGASHPCCGSSSSRELGCCVRVPWNGTGLEAVARNKWDGPGTWGSQAAVALIDQCLPSFTTSLDSDQSTAGRFSWSRSGWRRIWRRGPFSGDEGPRPESCSPCRQEGQGGGSPWTSFKFSLGALCQRTFNVLCIT